jgi:hypothetical protein
LWADAPPAPAEIPMEPVVDARQDYIDFLREPISKEPMRDVNSYKSEKLKEKMLDL